MTAEWSETCAVAVAACGLGTDFPLLAETAVAPDAAAGRGVARLYVANIAGSVAGTLVTGFVFMDVLSLRAADASGPGTQSGRVR